MLNTKRSRDPSTLQTPSVLRQPHLQRNGVRRAVGQSQITPNNTLELALGRLQRIETLQQPHNNIAGLGQSKLLANADPRSTVERQKLPTGFSSLEALGLELFGVRAPEVFAAVHDVHAVVDLGVGGDDDGRLAVWSAAFGQGGDFVGAARVAWDDGPEAQGLVEAVLEVGAAFEGGEGDVLRVVVGAELVDDGGAELLEDLGVADQFVHEPREQRGRGITTSEENVQELGAELDGVAGLGGEFFQEDVALFVAAFFRELLAAGRFAQGQVDVVVDEGLDVLVVVLELFWVVQPVQVTESEALG
jgi:hypothetical protein